MPPEPKIYLVYEPDKADPEEIVAEAVAFEVDGRATFYRDGRAIAWIAPGAWAWIMLGPPPEKDQTE